MEVKVKVLQNGNGNNILDQYIQFTKICDEQTNLRGRTREAVAETIRICIKQGILTEFLRSREKEVIDIMDTLFDQERIFNAAMAERERDAREEGNKEGKKELVSNLLKMGVVAIEDIAKAAGFSVAEVKRMMIAK